MQNKKQLKTNCLNSFSKHISVFTLAREYLRNIAEYFTTDQLDVLTGLLAESSPTVFKHPLLTQRLQQLYVARLPDLHQVRKIHQFMALGGKFPFKGQDSDCKVNALHRFFNSETQCHNTNSFFERSELRFSDYQAELVSKVRRIITSVLGHTVPSDIMSTGDLFFGPGSAETVNVFKPSETTEYFKLIDTLACNRESRDFLYALLSSHPNVIEAIRFKFGLPVVATLQDELKILTRYVDHSFETNRITFVPKSMDTHRTIAIEPSGQIPLQKVLGSYIRRRLKTKGLDLDTQQKNRSLARLCKTLGLSTIDLAMASDTVATSVVKLLLPPSWFIIFNTFRSKYGECKDKEHSFSVKYEKFSSMGNGFTFELESLIFWAIAIATVQLTGDQGVDTRNYVKVFGDDIIIPQPYTMKCVENLEFFGFSVNHDKSFSSGLFYESCGADFYDSRPVRPFFLKREITSIRDYHFVINSLILLSIRQKRTDLRDIIALLKRNIPKRFRNYGPINLYPSQDIFGHDSFAALESHLFTPMLDIPHSSNVRFCNHRYGMVYKSIQVKTIFASREEKSTDYFHHVIRYLIFLRGSIAGRIPLRGLTTPVLKPKFTSCWDGNLTPGQMFTFRYVSNFS